MIVNVTKNRTKSLTIFQKMTVRALAGIEVLWHPLCKVTCIEFFVLFHINLTVFLSPPLNPSTFIHHSFALNVLLHI